MKMDAKNVDRVLLQMEGVCPNLFHAGQQPRNSAAPTARLSEEVYAMNHFARRELAARMRENQQRTHQLVRTESVGPDSAASSHAPVNMTMRTTSDESASASSLPADGTVSSSHAGFPASYPPRDSDQIHDDLATSSSTSQNNQAANRTCYKSICQNCRCYFDLEENCSIKECYNNVCKNCLDKLRNSNDEDEFSDHQDQQPYSASQVCYAQSANPFGGQSPIEDTNADYWAELPYSDNEAYRIQSVNQSARRAGTVDTAADYMDDGEISSAVYDSPVHEPSGFYLQNESNAEDNVGNSAPRTISYCGAINEDDMCARVNLPLLIPGADRSPSPPPAPYPLNGSPAPYDGSPFDVDNENLLGGGSSVATGTDMNRQVIGTVEQRMNFFLNANNDNLEKLNKARAPTLIGHDLNSSMSPIVLLNKYNNTHGSELRNSYFSWSKDVCDHKHSCINCAISFTSHVNVCPFSGTKRYNLPNDYCQYTSGPCSPNVCPSSIQVNPSHFGANSSTFMNHPVIGPSNVDNCIRQYTPGPSSPNVCPSNITAHTCNFGANSSTFMNHPVIGPSNVDNCIRQYTTGPSSPNVCPSNITAHTSHFGANSSTFMNHPVIGPSNVDNCIRQYTTGPSSPNVCPSNITAHTSHFGANSSTFMNHPVIGPSNVDNISLSQILLEDKECEQSRSSSQCSRRRSSSRHRRNHSSSPDNHRSSSGRRRYRRHGSSSRSGHSRTTSDRSHRSYHRADEVSRNEKQTGDRKYGSNARKSSRGASSSKRVKHEKRRTSSDHGKKPKPVKERSNSSKKGRHHSEKEEKGSDSSSFFRSDQEQHPDRSHRSHRSHKSSDRSHHHSRSENKNSSSRKRLVSPSSCREDNEIKRRKLSDAKITHHQSRMDTKPKKDRKRSSSVKERSSSREEPDWRSKSTSCDTEEDSPVVRPIPIKKKNRRRRLGMTHGRREFSSSTSRSSSVKNESSDAELPNQDIIPSEDDDVIPVDENIDTVVIDDDSSEDDVAETYDHGRDVESASNEPNIDAKPHHNVTLKTSSVDEESYQNKETEDYNQPSTSVKNKRRISLIPPLPLPGVVTKRNVPNPSEVLFNRQKIARQSSIETAAITSAKTVGQPTVVRCVPNVKQILEATKAVKEGTYSGFRTAAQNTKGVPRVAHTPTTSTLADIRNLPASAMRRRPTIDTGKKFSANVPVTLRQEILDKLYAALASKIPPELSKKRALEIEESIVVKVNRPKVYRRSAMLKIHSIEIADAATLFQEANDKHEVPKELYGISLYDLLKKYILTDEEYKVNGYPMLNEDGHFKISSEARYYKPLHQKRDNDKYVCCNCKEYFTYNEETGMPEGGQCCFHTERHAKEPGRYTSDHFYKCCNAKLPSPGCKTNDYHVGDPTDDDDLVDFVVSGVRDGPDPPDKSVDFYALDCEMVYTTNGVELARLTVISYDSTVVYDELVKPKGVVLDYVTKFSGITAESLKNVTKTQEEARDDLLKKMSKNTILIGHSLENDLKALKLYHRNVVDTSVMFPHPKEGRKYQLKVIAYEMVEMNIQQSIDGHDSSEDALACLKLVMKRLEEDARACHRRVIVNYLPMRNEPS